MKYAVIGSRSFTDYQYVESILSQHNITMIVSGGADGVDTLAERYADYNNIPKLIIDAEWDKYGQAAGMIRNKLIIEASDIVIAVWDGISPGTKDAVKYTQKLKKKLYVYNPNSLFEE
jgi:predicted Rossmann fold nucleotide-binding protein DprA/Smf involved in DNA uptake